MTFPKEQQLIQIIKKLGIIRPKDLREHKIAPQYLKILVEKGLIQKLSRGIYAHIDYEFDENQSILEVCKRAPHAVICLLSALTFHQFTTQNPFQVWFAVESSDRIPKIEHPPVRVFKFKNEAYSEGFQIYNRQGVDIKVYSPAKTITDCFKYRNKIGLDVALEALREGWRKKLFNMDELFHYGNICRVNKIMKPYLESL